LCGGPPKWSHGGSRIAFAATPGNQFQRSRLMAIEVHDGRPTYIDLGPGFCPTFSRDDKRIAFALNVGAEPGARPGVWVMQADGSQRQWLGASGSPFWSPDGREFMLLTHADFPVVTVMNLEKVTGATVAVRGYRVFSWPSWAGPDTLVSALSTGDGEEGDIIALLDVSNPAEAKIIEVLWQRGKELDVTPRWTVYSPETHRCLFLGVVGDKRTLYSLERGKSRRATPVEIKGHNNNKLGCLAFSPDGRYLLLGDNRP
jgi:hypothetical protein